MTRRELFAALVGLPITGRIEPTLGGFNVSGHFEEAGADNTLAYYSMGQGICLMLDPKYVPACIQGADALVKGNARLILEKA